MTIITTVGTNYYLDYYGLFRNISDRKLIAYGNERTGKYLFSYRYIPVNFDGILIGSSFSNNMDVTKIGEARVYNASIDGGNITEGKLIAENVLRRGKMKLVIFAIHPYLTKNHGRKSGFMDPSEYWGALGSIQLYKDYCILAMNRLGFRENLFDENGRYSFEEPPLEVAKFRSNRSIHKPDRAGPVDEVAFDEYLQLVQTARSHGAKIAAFMPPIYFKSYEADKNGYDKYFARFSALFLPGETVVNFNLPEYSVYTRDSSYFQDTIHLSTHGAEIFSSKLAAAIQSH